MKTSEEIYNRIMTDPNLNRNLFLIVYKDVVKNKYVEVPAVKWLPVSKGGDVPYHRVDFIKFGEKVIWNRLEKNCIIEECIINVENEILPSNFKITTFNVLSDEYEKTLTNINKRLSSIMSYIFDNTLHDIICLQEVQPLLLVEIKKHIGSQDSEFKHIAHTTMGFNDIIIMSKTKPILHEIINLGQQKSAIMVKFRLEQEQELTIVGIHLTSDYYDDNSAKRTNQLYKIKQKVAGSNNVILLGDTNELTYEHNLSHFCEYVDCWIESSKVKGFTYDPSSNNLAHKLATNKTPLRLDRIVYTQNGLIVSNNVSIDNSIKFSDHYPLTAQFIINDVVHEIKQIDVSKPINQTALCIIPPYESWELINNYKISTSSDVMANRWMPHLNLFFGFVQPEHFYEIYSNITNLFGLVGIQPFEIEFDKLGYFQHERTYTLYLQPSDQSIEVLRNLHSKLASSQILKLSCFDAKVVFNPHIALGNTDDFNKITAALRQHINIKIMVNQLNFVSRVGFEYFKTIRCINLVLYPMNFYIDFVKYVANLYQIITHVCGSRYFELVEDNTNSDTNSDADLLCIGGIPRDEFFSKVTRTFETCGYFRKVSIVKNKFVYCLKLKTNDSNIDIQYVDSNNQTEIYYSTGMAILNEPKYIVESVGTKLSLFRECLSWMRTQMKQKGLYSAIHCFIGGMSVAIIVGTIVKNPQVIDLYTFIQELKLHNFDNPTHIGGASMYKKSKNPCDRLMYIGTSTPPIENTARHICKSTTHILKHQFACGFDNEKYLELASIFVKTIRFEIIATNDDALEECITWFNGIVTMMLVAIERNSKDIILWPSTSWAIEKQEGQLSAKWELKATHDYASLNYTAEKAVEKSKTLFIDAFLSFS